MDSYEGSGSPRFREDDTYPSYRRRSSISPDRRRPSFRARSRSPITIDRYQPDDRDRDHREYSRDRLPRDHRDRDGRDSYRERPLRRDGDRTRDDYYAREREVHDADRERERDKDRDRLDRRRALAPPLPPAPMSPMPFGVADRYVPGQDSPSPLVRANALPSPMSLDFQVGFGWFAEWWRAEQAVKEEKERAKHGGRRQGGRESREEERARIQEAYDRYKSELQMKLARQFVQQHRGEEWFREKYIQEVREPIRRRLVEYRKNNALKQWQQDLANGVFDEFTLEGIHRLESDGAGGVIEKEEGEATAIGETLSVMDLLPAKGGDLRDDAALQAPALLVKTLAPNVSRESIENFCRESLGEEKGGFEWLSLSDPNPTKRFHRMGWVMLKLDPEAGQEAEGTDRDDGRANDAEEGEEGEAEEKAKKVKRSPALATAENALPFLNEKPIKDPLRGDFTVHVGVHFPPPHPRKKALWDLFSAPARIEKDLELAKRITRKFDAEMGEGLDGVTAIEERVEALNREGKLVPPLTSASGSKPAKRREAALSEDMDDPVLAYDREQNENTATDAQDGEDEGEVGEDDADPPALLVQKKELDLLVEYLRRVYSFCLFCVFEADSAHELVRKCPGGHLRRPRSGLSTAALEAAQASAKGEPFPLEGSRSGHSSEETRNGDEGERDDRSHDTRRVNRKFANKNQYQLSRAFNWVRTYEDKLLQLLEPQNADLARLGGQPLDAALDAELKKHVKQEDENRFRCKVPECTKLFKAEHFWRKHVEKRHPDWLREITAELELVNAYVLDPGHVVLGRDAPGGGGGGAYYGFGAGVPVPNGIKGYNIPPGMLNPHHPFPMATGPGVPPFPAPWPLAASDAAARLAAHHGAGAVRRGGAQGYSRYGSRYTPYERRTPGAATPSGALPYGVPPSRMHAGASPAGFGGVTAGVGGGVPGDAAFGAGMFGQGQAAVAGMVNGGGAAGGMGLPAGAGGGVNGVGVGVPGRSLKSYEDLDAVEAGAGGELNY